MTLRLALFPDTTRIATTPNGERLTIAGCDLASLADRYGTPLYLYDRATMDTAVAAYRAALSASYPGKGGITYAGKAFLCTAIAQWAEQNGLWVDCTGVGELMIARAAGLRRKHILVHGVNKSPAELVTAVHQAGTIVVDNLTELERLIALWPQASPPFPDLWLRFRPGLAVDTHAHTQTGQAESKFGMNEDEILCAVRLCRQHHLPLKGVHFHQGSHFRDPAPLGSALVRTLDLVTAIGLEEDWLLCPGGGWAVAYHEDDLPPPSIEAYVRYVAEHLVAGCQERGLPLPRLHLEPGRSLIARAGVALYRVGTVKQSANRRWLLLDGGMTDNPRPALYGARYSALPVRRPRRPATHPAWLAGPHCESGDLLIQDLPLPPIQPGEILAVPASGAYQLSMSSNYNGARRPPVLWLDDGQARLFQTRETPQDLLRRDRRLWPIEAPEQQAKDPPPNVRFAKYHALGNDYLVLNPLDVPGLLTPPQIRLICDRHRGLGSDGLLLGPLEDPECDFGLRLFNPDGSEFEKSGNGLRIFSRYLWDGAWVQEEPFTIATTGGKVTSQVHRGGQRVTVNVGTVSFDSRTIPVTGPPREVLNEVIPVGGQEFRFCAVTTGNPHCVLLCDEVSARDARRWGPLVERDARFPNRTNVEFIKVLDRANIQIEIWERGVGYTLSSGTGSCAAASVAYRLGLCGPRIVVHMPGGEIDISIAPDFAVSMSGPVSKVCEGVLAVELFGHAEPQPPG
jgi:diaminopimelate decarboxylase/diaminopimelate epimerase